MLCTHSVPHALDPCVLHSTCTRKKARRARTGTGTEGILCRLFLYSKYLQPCYRVVAKYANGTYGRVLLTKDVIFNLTINFNSDFTDIRGVQQYTLPGASSWSRQCWCPTVPAHHVPCHRKGPCPWSYRCPYTTCRDISSTISATSDPYLPPDADVYNDADIDTKYDEESKIQYWYKMRCNLSTEVKTGDPYPVEFSRIILETQHWRSTKLLCALGVRDSR